MTTVQVHIANSLPTRKAWEVPQENQQLRSPVPGGFITFKGVDDIPALDAANVTAYRLTLTMPNGFVYLIRTFDIRFQSDDLTNDFDDNGSWTLSGPSFAGSFLQPSGNLLCPGEVINNAANSNRIWEPRAATGKYLLRAGDSVIIRLNDMSADASTAGDMAYFFQFYVFKVDQADKWELNTPIPVISHSSF